MHLQWEGAELDSGGFSWHTWKTQVMEEEVKEEQATVLRHLLVDLENKEAEAAESEDGLAEEFSVSLSLSRRVRSSRNASQASSLKKTRERRFVVCARA